MSDPLIITGLTEVVNALTGAAPKLDTGCHKAVAVNARKVQQGARRRVQGLAHAPAYPASITYDITDSPGGTEAEIGPDKERRQGALGNILEFGTRNNGPTPHLGPAAEENADDLYRGVETAVTQALGL